MSKFESYLHNLDEGFFLPDRYEIKLYGKTEDELKEKINDFMKKYKSYDPKVSKIATDKLGRFYVIFSYNKYKSDEDKSLLSLIKNIPKSKKDDENIYIVKTKTKKGLERKIKQYKKNPNVEMVPNSVVTRKNEYSFKYKLKNPETTKTSVETNDDKTIDISKEKSKNSTEEYTVTKERLSDIKNKLNVFLNKFDELNLTPQDLKRIENTLLYVDDDLFQKYFKRKI